MTDLEIRPDEDQEAKFTNYQEIIDAATAQQREELDAAKRRQRGLRADQLSNQVEHFEADQRVAELTESIRQTEEEIRAQYHQDAA